MRVVQATRFGGPEVLVTVGAADPVAGPGEVVVDVTAADTLFVETQIRRGWGGEFFTVQPPYVPGGAVSGRVYSVGPAVDERWVGRRVAAHTGDHGGGGGYAEQVVVAEERLVPVPDELGDLEAVALMHDGPTALRLIDAAGIRPGHWVLILAAGGGLGILLVQLAHGAGGRVIAAARGRRKLDLAAELGADIVVDYSKPNWAQRVLEATSCRGADAIFDGVGGELGRAAFDVVATGGQFSMHGAPSGAFADIPSREAQRRGVTLRGIEDVQVAPVELRQLAVRALSEAAAGRVRPVIGQTFPLHRAAEAHRAIESRSTVGKTLLEAR
jgi:NADPH:quinone reductase